MSGSLNYCHVETATLSNRLWVKNRDYDEKTPPSACSASEDGQECLAEAFVRVWRSDKPGDMVSLCSRHARNETPIFFVEPLSRQDFHSSEYEFLLERSTLGQRITENLEAPRSSCSSAMMEQNCA
jgi:hypothetical protein